VNVVKPAATMMNIVQESKQEKHTNLTWFDNMLTLIGTKSFISLYVKLGLHNVY
jgi:imidazoleglycerol phosphate dehydratase HisB